MPGTIQVTVVEFKGVSSDPSANSLKVSMGKTHYRTWDKGDFSFPISRIRENLVVALLDAGGNATAQQDIRTMQIIEKGCWDEVFTINGGGHVHLKLQFILTEADRNRIRIMRETAMKKKLETNPNMKLLRLSEGIASTSQTSTKVEETSSDYQKWSVEVNGAVPLSSPQEEGEGILESGIPNATEAPCTHVTETQERVAIETRAHRDQGPASKTPTNVRKMISAFENPKLQEAKPLRKASSVPAQLNRLRKAEEKGHLVKTVGGHESYEAPKELPESATSSGRSDEEEKNRLRKGGLLEEKGHLVETMVGHDSYEAPKDLPESATSSGRTDEEEESRGGTGEECERSGMWIFPDDTRRLCVTTAGHRDNEVENISNNVMHLESEKKQPESEAVTPPSNGLVGQVIRVAAILGFGVLVLVTRQKEPRKNERCENEHVRGKRYA